MHCVLYALADEVNNRFIVYTYLLPYTLLTYSLSFRTLFSKMLEINYPQPGETATVRATQSSSCVCVYTNLCISDEFIRLLVRH